jgi:carbon starvation protein CstA
MVVVKALAHSPWGVFSIAATIPIALFMGVYMRYLRPGKIAEVSIIGLSDDGRDCFGGDVAKDPYWGHFHFNWNAIDMGINHLWFYCISLTCLVTVSTT